MGHSGLKAKDSVLLTEEDPFILFGSFAKIKGKEKGYIYLYNLFIYFYFFPYHQYHVFSSILITCPGVKGFLDTSKCSDWALPISEVLLELYTFGALQLRLVLSLLGNVSNIYLRKKDIRFPPDSLMMSVFESQPIPKGKSTFELELMIAYIQGSNLE